MQSPIAFARRLIASQRGATAVEYGLILAGIVLAIFGAVQTLGGATSSIWGNVNDRVTNAR